MSSCIVILRIHPLAGKVAGLAVSGAAVCTAWLHACRHRGGLRPFLSGSVQTADLVLWCKQRAAEDAAAAVGVTYSSRDAEGLDELPPPVLTLEDAVAMESFHDCAGGLIPPHPLVCRFSVAHGNLAALRSSVLLRISQT